MSELKIETELTRQIEELSHYLEFSTTHNVPLSKTKNKTSHVPVSFGRWGWWANQLRIFWTSISFPFGTSTFFLMKGWRVFMVLEHRERRESPEKYGRRPIPQTRNNSASSVLKTDTRSLNSYRWAIAMTTTIVPIQTTLFFKLILTSFRVVTVYIYLHHGIFSLVGGC